MRTPSDEFLRDVAITAVECGVDYWAVVEGYRWLDDDGTELPFPKASIIELDDGGSPVAVHALTKDAVLRGINALLSGSVNVNPLLVAELRDAIEGDDAGMVDAEMADCVVQAALFNEIVYG